MKLYCSVFLWQLKLLSTEYVYLRWLLRILRGQPNYWTRDTIIETSTVVLTWIPEGWVGGGGAQSVLEIQMEWGGGKNMPSVGGGWIFSGITQWG